MYGKAKKKLEEMVGATVRHIYMTQDHLQFDTDKGDFAFSVDGDCCSTSVFYDFYGVKNLLKNGKITEIKEVDLEPSKTKDYNDIRNGYDSESISIYGVQFTTESEEYGQMTSVFSFRNYSNGYYGGFLEIVNPLANPGNEITDDVVEVKYVLKQILNVKGD